MILGEYNDLEILRFTSVGIYLGDDNNDVLLPQKYVKEDWEVGDVITVFISCVTGFVFVFLRARDHHGHK